MQEIFCIWHLLTVSNTFETISVAIEENKFRRCSRFKPFNPPGIAETTHLHGGKKQIKGPRNSYLYSVGALVVNNAAAAGSLQTLSGHAPILKLKCAQLLVYFCNLLYGSLQSCFLLGFCAKADRLVLISYDGKHQLIWRISQFFIGFRVLHVSRFLLWTVSLLANFWNHQSNWLEHWDLTEKPSWLILIAMIETNIDSCYQAVLNTSPSAIEYIACAGKQPSKRKRLVFHAYFCLGIKWPI